jgi:hypothetical protein
MSPYRGLDCRKEAGVILMWPDVHRDHEVYIYTWLGTGEVREWTDVPLQASIVCLLCLSPSVFLTSFLPFFQSFHLLFWCSVLDLSGIGPASSGRFVASRYNLLVLAYPYLLGLLG